MITLEKHNGIIVLRDDLLPGGTKSILLPDIVTDEHKEFVYASPVYGGFQIALSLYCKSIGKKATIFCAARKNIHANTLRCLEAGANVIQVPYGYLSVIEARSREYCQATGAKKIEFGVSTENAINKIAERMVQISGKIGKEPNIIYCAIGSGTLVKGILKGTASAIIRGVQVGKALEYKHDRLELYASALPFEKECKQYCPFPSMKNYDLKAWKLAGELERSGTVLFWNVL